MAQQLTLETLTSECERVIKTLPLAHYFKVKTIPVVFDKYSPTSYFDSNKFEIHVALANIVASLNGNGKTEISDYELENIVRCFLYHEVSHAILTPKNLMILAHNNGNSGNLCDKDMANIIEDERIETLLKHYYNGVDFKKNLKNTVPLKHAENFTQFVFNAVRFRYCPTQKKYVNELMNKLINKCKDITGFDGNNRWNENNDNGANKLIDEFEKLLKELKIIWDSLPKANQPQSNQQSDGSQEEQDGSSQSEQSEETDNSQSGNDSEEETDGEDEDTSSDQQEESSGDEDEDSEDTDTESEETDNTDNTESEDTKGETENEETTETEEEEQGEEENLTGEENGESQEETEEYEDDFLPSSDEVEMKAEDIEELVKQAVLNAKMVANKNGGYKMKLADFICDKNTKCDLLKIIGKNTGFGNNQNQAMYGYSGKFNTKRFATDFSDSCKWFKKKSFDDTGINAKKNNKKVLNIWLDNSGSFRNNDDEVNKILKALYEIEKQRDDFQFNFVKVDDHFVELKGEDRFSKSEGGNRLPKDEIEKNYKNLNPTGNEFNIVLFDGQCGTDTEYIYIQKKRLENEIKRKTKYDEQTRKIMLDRLNQQVEDAIKCDSYENLKVFNNQKSIFITENANTEPIKRVCNNAKAIIEENSNYAGQLKANILKAFDLLF